MDAESWAHLWSVSVGGYNTRVFRCMGMEVCECVVCVYNCVRVCKSASCVEMGMRKCVGVKVACR